MAYVPVPKDLSKIKTKVAFNLTKRQSVCFAAALITGLPLFFLLKDSAGTSAAAFVERQRKLEKEVSAIVKGTNQRRRTGKKPRN